jgi:hypothetical protein
MPRCLPGIESFIDRHFRFGAENLILPADAAALDVGCTREAVAEVIMQMAVYAGFPATLDGLAAAKESFAARRADGRKEDAAARAGG